MGKEYSMYGTDEICIRKIRKVERPKRTYIYIYIGIDLREIVL
jgi:hypothetical protein